MKKIIVFVSFLAISLSVSAFSQLVVFGDSLSDGGVMDNTIAQQDGTCTAGIECLPVGKAATWTTKGGIVWPVLLADKLGITKPTPNNADFPADNVGGIGKLMSGDLKGTDYAAGGTLSGTGNLDEVPLYKAPNMLTQVAAYMADTSKPVQDNTLYVIWTGANDFACLGDGKCTAAQLPAIAAGVVANVQTAVIDLDKHANGKKITILVVDIPNLSITPLLSGLPAIEKQALSALLSQSVTGMEGAMVLSAPVKATTTVKFMSVFNGLNEMRDAVIGPDKSYKKYGVTINNITTKVCGEDAALKCKTVQTTTIPGDLFADDEHPTAIGHIAIAGMMESCLASGNLTC
jgi:phospholipase/lecithinase/hemolysin